MKSVGVRELKNRATQIVREVRESQAEYVVTVDGEPVAVLRPFTNQDVDAHRTAEVQEWIDELKALAAKIGKSWPKEVSAVDAVREQRR